MAKPICIITGVGDGNGSNLGVPVKPAQRMLACVTSPPPEQDLVVSAPSMHTIAAHMASLKEDPETATRQAISNSVYKHTVACASKLTT